MKIALVLNHFLPERLAGIEVYTFNIAKSLQRLGIDVIVITPLFDGTENDTYLYEGIKVIRYKENSVNDRDMISGLSIPNGLNEFINVIREERPSLIHFQEIAAGRGISLHHVRQCASLNIKLVLTCHLSTYSCQTGNLLFKEQVFCDGLIRTHACTTCVYHSKGIKGFKNDILQSASKFLYKTGANPLRWRSELATALGFPFLIDKKKKDLIELSTLCDRFIVISNWYKAILRNNGIAGEKVMYIAQAVNSAPQAINIRATKLPVKMVFVGRICEDKGIHLLIQAIKNISASRISVDLYGPVTEQDYFENCRALSKDMKNINWKGLLSQNQVSEVLSNHDLLCLPSTFSEMSPLVIQEAFAAGIPVLASNVYGNAEQISDGVNGWLFEFKNIAALSEKIEMLLDDPTLIDAAKQNILPPKNFNEVAKEHIELYKCILNLKLETNHSLK